MNAWAGFWIGLAIVIASANLNDTDRHDVACIKAGGVISDGAWYETPRCVLK